MYQFVIVFIAMLVGSFIQGATGIGYAMVSMPILSLFMPLPLASVTVLISALVLMLILLSQTWRFVKWSLIPIVVFSSLFGRHVGVHLLFAVPEGVLQVVLGLTLAALSGFLFLARQEVQIRPSRKNAMLAGFISGLFGGMFNVSGPPLAIFFLAATKNNLQYQGCLQASMVISGAYALVLHALYGNINPQVLSYGVVAIIAVIIGAALGLRLFRRMTAVSVRRAVAIVTASMGLVLIARQFVG